MILVIDDGSSDNTSQIAVSAGADKVVRHRQNLGIARTYIDCVKEGIDCDGDILVNIDADSQFNPQEIIPLTGPITKGKADVVIGSRFLSTNSSIPLSKRLTNCLLSSIISFISGQRITDSQSGFRAISRKAAKSLNLTGYFTYTQEMILDLASKRLRIVEVPVSVRYFKSRKSRVVKSIPQYAKSALGLIILAVIRIHGGWILKYFILMSTLLLFMSFLIPII